MKLTNAMTLPIFYAPLIDTDPVLPEEERRSDGYIEGFGM